MNTHTIMRKYIPKKKIALYFTEGNGRGDALMASMVLRAIKVQNPKSITACVLNHTELLEHNPFVDIAFDPKKDRVHIYNYSRVADEHYYLDYQRYREVLNSQWIPNFMTKKCNAKLVSDTPDLYLTKEEVLLGKKIINAIRERHKGRLIIAFQAGCNSINREWMPEKWHSLIDSIRGEVVGVQIGDIGDPIIQNSISLVGRISARIAGAIVKSCDAVIGNDSFINHLAAAVDVPGIIIFGSSNPIAFGYKCHLNLHTQSSLLSSDSLFDTTEPISNTGLHNQLVQQITPKSVADILRMSSLQKINFLHRGSTSMEEIR